MRILGISNPDFLGVSVATRAICTDWLPAPHMASPHEWQQLASAIFHKGPDVLVVGGWSKGYIELLTELKRSGNKEFPILNVSHSTQFHGSYFHKDWQEPEFETAFKRGLVDLMGFVHPQTAEYYQKVRRTFAVWVPHAFPLQTKVVPPATFRIGILGADHWYKNTEGPKIIARDFAANHKNVEVVESPAYSRPQEAFLAMLRSCSVLVHLSHLECYSNTVQEAWARGIPVITSPSSSGLVSKNPLLTGGNKYTLSNLQLTSATEPMELYEKLLWVREGWGFESIAVHQAYRELCDRTAGYLNSVFVRLINDYPNREHDVGFFESPFAREGLKL
jgi:hypothetical protein